MVTSGDVLAVGLLIAVIRVAIGPRVVRYLRWKDSEKWPFVVGKIRGASFEEVSRGEDGVTTLMNMAFAYEVNGIEYEGLYVENVGTQAAGEHQLANYSSLPLYVRYNPTSPSKHVLDPYRDVRLNS